jgi:hypothetical protein
LLVGMGDGSPYWPKDIGPSKRGETGLVALDLDSPDGKILRVDPATGRGVRDNPFYDASRPDSVRSKVLAYGLRNPFRFYVDRKSGDVWIGDPGSSFWEELDRIPAKWSVARGDLDFGWPCYEGGNGHLIKQPAMVNVPTCKRRFYSQSHPRVATPAYAYHFTGSAIIAGPIYNGTKYPKDERGRLFFSDFVHDTVFTYHNGKVSRFGSSGGWDFPVEFGTTLRGNLAYVSFTKGQLRELVYVGKPGASAGGGSVWPWIVIAAAGAAVLVGLGLVVGRRRARGQRTTTATLRRGDRVVQRVEVGAVPRRGRPLLR